MNYPDSMGNYNPPQSRHSRIRPIDAGKQQQRAGDGKSSPTICKSIIQPDDKFDDKVTWEIAKPNAILLQISKVEVIESSTALMFAITE